MKKLLKFVGWSIGGLVGVVLLLIGVAFLMNWNDEPPSEAALKLARLLEDQAPLPDESNGYVYALGFQSPEGVDPQEAGALRRAWIETVNSDSNQFELGEDVELDEYEPHDLPLRKQHRELCAQGAAADCRVLFEHVMPELRFTEVENRFVERYRAMLQRPGWREVIPLDERLPYAPYSDILHAQRLMMIDLMKRRGPGSAADVRATLHADHEFWRMVMTSANHLVTQMIAVAALRQNFYFGNLVVKHLPAEEQLAALPDGWMREFSPEELDMRQVMAGEFRYAEHLMRNLLNPAFHQARSRSKPGPGPGAQAARTLMEPWYQPQDQINFYADQYLAMATAFQVPLAKYHEAESACRAREAAGYELNWSLYNPIGQWMRAEAGLQLYSKYPMRVASVEAMRRAVLLTTQLRSRNVDRQQLGAELQAAELRNPFDGEPFEWSESERAVVYVGPDNPAVKQHFYYY